MSNDSKNIKKEQKTNSVTSFYQEIRNSEYDELINEENDLNTKKAEFGYGDTSWENLFVLSIEDLGQAEASQVLSLQESYKTYQTKKHSFQSTIYLEPSKLPEVVEDAEKLLLSREDHIYQRSGKLVHIAKILHSPINKRILIKRSHDAVIIKEIDQAFLTVHLTKRGNFLNFDTRTGKFKKIDCPERISKYLLAKQQWNIPVLTGIINAPTLRADCSILDEPGYDDASGLLFFPGNYTFGKIPTEPTLEDAQRAKDELLKILEEFPFENATSKSVTLAAILTALVRRSITTAPLFGFTAPKMASGKSLLADVVSLIATGKPNSVIAQAENETEEKKRIMAVLIEGDPIVCYDNVEKPFKSAALCSILTQQEYKDRLLGGNETRTVLTTATFLVTGNNLIFMGDISTRALLCKLDPQVEHPEERSFAIDLRKYIPENRNKLVLAGLIILRAYHVAGSPVQNIEQFGRFEEWNRWIRSAIVWLGMADPYETRKDIQNNDPIRIMLNSLFMTWYKIFGDRSIKLKELKNMNSIQVNNAIDDDDNDEIKETFQESLLELAGDKNGAINQRSLAKKLALYKNRIEGGLRLEQNGIHQGTSLWRIRKI